MTEGNSRPRVLVTGGRRGIGRGIAFAFAAAGYDVVVNDIVEDDAARETLAGIAERGGRGVFLKANIAEVEGLPSLVDKASAAFGGLECLVNNAGITVHKRGDLLEMTLASYDEVMAVNLRGPFFLTQEIAKRFLGASSNRPRSIVSISSMNAAVVAPDRGEYTLSKTGVSVMTKLFALRLAESGIGVFEIRPGIIRTDMTAPVKERYDTVIGQGIVPMRRWGEPADIGRVAVALASGDFHFSTGDAIDVDGGIHIHRL
jgi:3-oxoacyl-[acyl-carrier protein] reductase